MKKYFMVVMALLCSAQAVQAAGQGPQRDVEAEGESRGHPRLKVEGAQGEHQEGLQEEAPSVAFDHFNKADEKEYDRLLAEEEEYEALSEDMRERVKWTSGYAEVRQKEDVYRKDYDMLERMYAAAVGAVRGVQGAPERESIRKKILQKKILQDLQAWYDAYPVREELGSAAGLDEFSPAMRELYDRASCPRLRNLESTWDARQERLTVLGEKLKKSEASDYWPLAEEEDEDEGAAAATPPAGVPSRKRKVVASGEDAAAASASGAPVPAPAAVAAAASPAAAGSR